MGISDRRTLALLGGDRRQIAMAKKLAEDGYRIHAWGLPDADLSPEIRVDPDWKSAVDVSDAVILPLPASSDGVRVFAPLLPEDAAGLRLRNLFAASAEKPILGGNLSAEVLRAAEACGVVCTDYFDSEPLRLKNALATAEGAISIAMTELPVTIFGTEFAVIGYGRIASLLAEKFVALGGKVYVYARRPEALTRAALARCIPVDLSVGTPLRSFPPRIRAVFNTVPERLVGAEELNAFPPGCVWIDLASFPGGVDFAAAKERGICTVWGTALPGKYAPESAGEYLAASVAALLSTVFDHGKDPEIL